VLYWADADFDGHPYAGESSVFGTFDGCTWTPADDYAYPPDAPSDCSPNCYMQTPERYSLGLIFPRSPPV